MDLRKLSGALENTLAIRKLHSRIDELKQKQLKNEVLLIEACCRITKLENKETFRPELGV